MPYIVKKQQDQYRIYTQGADGEPIGDAHGSHPTMDAAHEQMKALYASVPAAKEGKAILLPLSDDGDPFKIGDCVCFDGWDSSPTNGAPITVGSAFMGIIRAINGTVATLEYLDTTMQPRGDTCIRPLSTLREYMLPGASSASDATEAKGPRIEFVTSEGTISGVEYKSIGGLEPQSINGRTVDGIAAVFGNVDDASDITHPGAFKKTLQEQGKRVMFTFNHEIMDTPRAKIDEIREIGRDALPYQIKSQYPQATGGLFVRRTYLETPRGEETLAGVKSGAIAEMSYGYQAIKKDYDKYEGKSVRNLREVRLIDICDTTLGVNPATVSKKSALEFRMLGLTSGVKAARDLLAMGVDFKAGRRNSANDQAKIQSVIDALEQQLETLEELLGIAEPPAEEAAESATEGKALTSPDAMLALLDLALIELRM